MEEGNNDVRKLRTPAQEVLVSKVLKSRKILDKEYKQLTKVWEKQVMTSYEANVFITYVLSLLQFRRIFTSFKHKAYKRCHFCKSRDGVKRYEDLTTGKRLWLCENCELNYKQGSLVPIKDFEAREASADLYRKYEYPAEQEAVDEDKIHGYEESVIQGSHLPLQVK